MDRYRASDILGGDAPVVDAAVEELVGGVSRHERDLDGVVDVVVHLAVGAPFPGDLVGGEAAQVRFDSDERGHGFCRQGQWIGLLVGWVLGSRVLPSSTYLGAPEFCGSLEQ